MIQHVINHSSYHRGQIITLLRQQNITTFPSLDAIVYYREVSSAARQ